MNEERVILVDESDRETGTMEKLRAHQEGVLHRAFSVCIFNDSGELLLHKRAAGKYHSPDLWTNTCCSHPRPGERTSEAALRRLQEEMGFTCAIEPAFEFIYRAELDQDLIEHEYDHVFTGIWNGIPSPAADEVSEWEYRAPADVLADMHVRPERYTAWFRILLPRLIEERIHAQRA
jgi:isopentenyl-diphosphate Delta-isomerase